MRIFGFNISTDRDAEPAAKKDPTEYALSAGLWPSEARTGTVLSNAYQQVVWVYRAINALAEQVSNIPFRCSQRCPAWWTSSAIIQRPGWWHREFLEGSQPTRRELQLSLLHRVGDVWVDV